MSRQKNTGSGPWQEAAKLLLFKPSSFELPIAMAFNLLAICSSLTVPQVFTSAASAREEAHQAGRQLRAAAAQHQTAVLRVTALVPSLRHGC